MVLNPSGVLLAYRAGGPLNGATFTRTGSAMYRNRLGKLVTEATTDVPRVTWIDQDSDGRVDTPALLLERSATNEVTDPEALQTGNWSTTGLSSRSANQATGPEGTVTLDELIENTGSTTKRVTQTITGLTANVDHAASCWFIGNTRTFGYLWIGESGALGTNYFRAWINLSTGVVGTTDTGGNGSLTRAYVEDWTQVATGLYRLVVVGSVGTTPTAVDMSIGMSATDGNAAYTGDGSSSLYVGYAMLEDDVPSASSYTSTTRNAETVYFHFPTRTKPLTVYCRFQSRTFGETGTFNRLFQLGSATSFANPRLVMYYPSAAGVTFLNDQSGGAADVTVTTSHTWNDIMELVSIVDADGRPSLYASVNGGAVSSATGGTAEEFRGEWADTRFYLNSGGTGRQGTHAIRDLIVLNGALTGTDENIMRQCRRTRTAMGSPED